MKGAEDQYAWSTVNTVGNGPVAMVFANQGQRCRSLLGGLDSTVRMSSDQFCTFSAIFKMASTLARTDVAMKMWLSIVGAAKRDGHDAVSHRHG